MESGWITAPSLTAGLVYIQEFADLAFNWYIRYIVAVMAVIRSIGWRYAEVRGSIIVCAGGFLSVLVEWSS